jgi:hypothetical protein
MGQDVGASSGVLLAEVKEWDPPVLMQTVLPRIECEAVLAVRAEPPPSTG